jgi:GNAT superfamily N-acetyltransferase
VVFFVRNPNHQTHETALKESVLVRKATKDDAGRIAEYAMQLIEQHVGYDALRFSRIGSREGMEAFYGWQTEVENTSVLVAEVDGEVIGFAFVQFEPLIYAELATKVLWLHDIFVDTSSRATGAGRKLIDAVVAEAKRLGAQKILLSVAARNTPAQAFFEKAGFQTTMHEMMRVVGE